MFGIGGNELLIIAVFVIIIFGPDKIPEIARTVGKTVRMFKKVQEDVQHVINTEIIPADPFAAPAEKPAAVTPAAAPAAENAASASAIWNMAGEDDDEEGEEE